MIVTAALIEKDGNYLITQRLKGSHNALRWEFPGGKVDFGEDPRSCLEREIKEELNIDIKAKSILDYSSHVYDVKKHVLLFGFFCEYISGEIKLHGIKDYAWVNLKEMSKYDMTEADLPFIKMLKKL